MKILLEIMKLRFKFLSIFAPHKAADLAISLFQKPHFNKVRDREKEFLNSAKITKLQQENEDIILYETGDLTGKPIIAVHGWDSNPGSLSGITKKLADSGYHIYSLNVPAHGISKKDSTNMFETSELIIKILEWIDRDGEVSFVTHSFGSGAVSLALQKSDIKVDKLAFVTSPDKLWDIFKDYADMIGLNDKAFMHMIKITEQRFGRTFDKMHISQVLNDANFNKLLLVHDRDDKILPFSNSEAIHKSNPNSEIYSTTGKGHYRILWDEEVINKIDSFILN